MLVRLVILCCASLSAVTSLSTTGSRDRRQINFPVDDANNIPTYDDESGLERQGLPAFPTLPPVNQQFSTITSFIITPSVQNQTCICVPTGTCNSTIVTNPANTDGSGLLDIRIVNNPATQITPPVVTPATCQAGLVSCCNPGPYQCGVRYPPVANSPVPGPGQSPYGAYPWQVVLLSPGDVYVASGVLINAQNVLTVAHKVAQFITSPGTLKVRLGEWNAAGTNEPIPAQDFVVARVTSHPSFNSLNLKNDVAVLRLVNAVNLGTTPTITTACLPAVSFTGSRCWVSGWGRNDFNSGTFQAILKQVDVPILQQASCQAQLSATRLGSSFQFDTQSFICAGGEMGKDACTGDGGSPLVCQVGNQWFVAGLVAWGIGCGVSNVPGVYVNIQSYIPWIQSVAV